MTNELGTNYDELSLEALIALVRAPAVAWFTFSQMMALAAIIRRAQGRGTGEGAQAAAQAAAQAESINIAKYAQFIKTNEIRGLDGELYSVESLRALIERNK